MFSQSYFGYGLILSGTFIMLNERRRLPLPPGPRKFPFIGQLLAMPSEFPGHQFEKMGKELNTDILHLNVAGTSYVILNSFEAASDLLEKRSSIYSSRRATFSHGWGAKRHSHSDTSTLTLNLTKMASGLHYNAVWERLEGA
ncbi:cytochrome p450 [Moniliophthora roreri MCA 2997]|uniref:Cytochrome p450 n=1 Tax=Moniliophthora roreri (strain MCA 2997) TaxID=1381753 RepID=V2WSN9_MONRO|nr:cytochrome p450 [Moniliophthora roreri MCA 2997]